MSARLSGTCLPPLPTPPGAGLPRDRTPRKDTNQARSWMELAHHRAPPTAFHDTTVRELMRVLPDQHDRVANLLDLSSREVVAQIGVPALVVSAWCCYAGFMNERARIALEKAPPSQALRVWHHLRDKHGDAPFPSVLARCIQQDT